MGIRRFMLARMIAYYTNMNLKKCPNALGVGYDSTKSRMMRSVVVMKNQRRPPQRRCCCICWSFQGLSVFFLMKTMLKTLHGMQMGETAMEWFVIRMIAPSGTLTRRRHWQKLIFSFLDNVWKPGGKYIFLPSDLGCNCDRIPISTCSWRVFKPSFVLPWMLRSVPITLSHTFFSTCITSIQCLISRLD